MSYSLAFASLAFLAAFGLELRRTTGRDNGGVDFNITFARGTLGTVVLGLFRLGCLGDVSAALVLLPSLLFLADLFLPAGVRRHPAVVRAASLTFLVLGLVFATVDFTVNRCVGQTHLALDRLLTRKAANEKLAEEYVKWRKDFDDQLWRLKVLTDDLSSTSKEFNSRLPLFRGGSDEVPRRPNCTFSTHIDVKMEEFNIFYRLYHQNDRVGQWHKERLWAVSSTVIANKKRILELTSAIDAERKALADLKAEIMLDTQEQKKLRAPFWRDGARLAYQSRKAAENSLAVVGTGPGFQPRAQLFGVKPEAPFPRPRPIVMPENDLPLHAALAREEPQRRRLLAPRQQYAVARIDELWSHPPPVQYEQDLQEVSDIIHRDVALQIMPSWQPVQVVPEVPDVEMTDAPALMEFEMSGALGDACSAAHGSMELFQPAQVVGLQQHTSFTAPTPLPVFQTAPAPVQPTPQRIPPTVAPIASSAVTASSHGALSGAAAGGAASAGTTTTKSTTASTSSGGQFDLAQLAQATVAASAAATASATKPAPAPQPQPAQKSPAPAAPKTTGAPVRRPPQLLNVINWAHAPVGSTSSSFTEPEAPSVPEPSDDRDDDEDGRAKKKAAPSGSGGGGGPSNAPRPKPSASRAAASAASRRRHAGQK